MIDQLTRRRQKADSRSPEEVELRTQDTTQLVHDIIGKHQEYFADPQNRLEFIQSLSSDEFLHIAKYSNARLRSEKFHQLKNDPTESGGYLLTLHTPSAENKPLAFKSGYQAIQEYLEVSDDPVDKKIEGTAMAIEALVVLVHPFNDGNGRTSRFLGKLIEDGATNIDELIEQTAQKGTRGRIYSKVLGTTAESNLAWANNEDAMLEDDEREELREEAKSLPSDVEAMKTGIKRLLENDAVREGTMRHVRSRDHFPKLT